MADTASCAPVAALTPTMPSPIASNSVLRAPRGRMLPVLAPVIALLALAVVFLLWAAGSQGHVAELRIAAEIFVVLAGMAAIVQVYRQTRWRQRATLDLRRAEAKLSEIVDSAMDPIIVVDEDQRVLVFNPAAEAAFRWPRSAVEGQPLDTLIPERYRDAHRRHIQRFGEAGVTSRRMGGQQILMALRADGSEFPIEASISQHAENNRKLFTVILRDVSERVQAQALLAGSEARLRGILDSAMDAIITIDDSQRIVMFNAAAEAMFRCTRDEAIGAPLTWLLPDRHREAHRGHVASFGETGVASRRMGGLRVVTGLRRDGEEFPIDASISQVRDGDARFYTVILRDITERLRADDELRRSRAELQELGSTAHIAREHEKSRIARELHDELGQSLTLLQMDVAAIRGKVGEAQPEVVAKLDRMQSLLKTTVAATRRIAADLRPLMLDDLGIVPAVEWLVESFTQRTGVPCELAIADPDLKLDNIHSSAVYRIVQESLTNVAKHAHASQVKVAVATDTSDLVVQRARRRRGLRHRPSAQADVVRAGRGARARRRCWAAR